MPTPAVGRAQFNSRFQYGRAALGGSVMADTGVRQRWRGQGRHQTATFRTCEGLSGVLVWGNGGRIVPERVIPITIVKLQLECSSARRVGSAGILKLPLKYSNPVWYPWVTRLASLPGPSAAVDEGPGAPSIMYRTRPGPPALKNWTWIWSAGWEARATAGQEAGATTS